MKRVNLSYTTHLMIAAVIIVLGALIRKEHGMAGHWITLAAIGYYLLVGGRDAWRGAFRFNRLLPREKAHVLIYAVQALLLIQGIFTHTVGYFTLLVLLAVDYLLVPAPDDGVSRP